MQDQIIKIFDILENHGFEVYIVGGAVRDIVRGIEPKDYDFATSALPQQIMDVFRSEGYEAIPIGIEQGTITVILNHVPFHITTYRTYVNCDGRHCDIEYTGNILDDVHTRDFTINGLAMDRDNNILDDVNGLDDIRNKIIRTIENPILSYTRDYIRMLRAARFYTKLVDFEIEENTYKGIIQLHENLAKINRERIRDEFTEILLSNNRVNGILLLLDTQLMDIIIPDFSKLADIMQSPDHHPEGDVLTHTMLALSQVQENDPFDLKLATLLHDYGKLYTQVFNFENKKFTFINHEIVGAEKARIVLKNLHYNLNIVENVYELISSHMVFHQDVTKMRRSTIERQMLKKIDGFSTNPLFDDKLKLLKYDIEASDKDFKNYNNLLSRVKDIREDLKKKPPVKLITGYDVMELGVKPGPIIADLIEKVEDAQLEGLINTREDALELLRRIVVAI